jgi:hypothetical protein
MSSTFKKCSTCSNEIPASFPVGMVCAMCLLFGANRHSRQPENAFSVSPCAPGNLRPRNVAGVRCGVRNPERAR